MGRYVCSRFPVTLYKAASFPGVERDQLFYKIKFQVDSGMLTKSISYFRARNDALKEAMGYIMGMGFAFKAKPYAFASSSCANKVI